MVNVGSSTDDASYKLEKKTGNGAYETVKTWDNGDLATVSKSGASAVSS